MKTDNEESGELGDSNGVLAQYQTTRIRALGWTSYKRIFQLAKEFARTLDPSDFRVTNKFPYNGIVRVWPDDKTTDQFNLEYDRTVFVYKTLYRSQLLCQLFEYIYKSSSNKAKAQPINSQRISKNGLRTDCKLTSLTYGIQETNHSNKILQEYYWINISNILIDEKSNGIVIEYSNRIKAFIIQDLAGFINNSKGHIKNLGITNISIMSNQSLPTQLNLRNEAYTKTGMAIAIYDINKYTKRYERSAARQFHITEDFIIEKDSSGFQYVSYHKVTDVYALVRNINNQKEFTIEYQDGSSRSYSCGVRDTLLATLLDICHAAGNSKVTVTGELSDYLRLMPRYTEEDYQSSITDAFFGASSIENWFLTKLSKVCKSVLIENSLSVIEETAKEFNANVPAFGISPNSDITLVKTCLVGILKYINTLVVQVVTNNVASSTNALSTTAVSVEHSKVITILLQTLHRIIPCVNGYKAFVEIKEIDSRLLIYQLLKFENDFINYWSLQILTVLCKCPLNPRNSQQEFVNKHTLLTDKMLTCLIELLSSSITEDIEEIDDEIEEGNIENQEEEQSDSNFDEPINMYKADRKIPNESLNLPNKPPPPIPTDGKGDRINNVESKAKPQEVKVKPEEKPKPQENIPIDTKKPAVKPNPSTTSHLPTVSDINPTNQARKAVFDVNNLTREQNISSLAVSKQTSFPNSLVIVSSAVLLESIVSSNRDTSSPELLNRVYSPSSAQRFISRFLVATWMSGSDKTNPAKGLLLRILPSGLIEYLKFKAITEEHRKNLDEIEEEFYTIYNNLNNKSHINSNVRKTVKPNDLQIRMRKRISTVLKEQNIDRVSKTIQPVVHTQPGIGTILNQFEPQNPVPNTLSGPPGTLILAPENYRIIHV
eukprot:gene18453-24160_t